MISAMTFRSSVVTGTLRPELLDRKRAKLLKSCHTIVSPMFDAINIETSSRATLRSSSIPPSDLERMLQRSGRRTRQPAHNNTEKFERLDPTIMAKVFESEKSESVGHFVHLLVLALRNLLVTNGL